MEKYQRYKIAILILSVLLIIESTLLIYLWISLAKRIPKSPTLVEGKITIVIDDWGYNLNNLHILERIKYPLTISILPNLKFSKAIAEEVHRQGRQIILHLPMQPHEKVRLEQDTIMIFMDEPTIIDIIDKNLADIPYVSGVSNHMGSKATEDLKTMGIIFKELKKRNLYFLDSLVSPKSVCSDLSKTMHIMFAQRDVFLDNKKEPEYIRKQIHRLKTKARIYGQAIGIGHDRKITLEILREVMPNIEEEGYKFVFVSELVR